MNAPNLRKWWSTIKTAVFGASSSLPLMVDRRGRRSGHQMRRPHCFRRRDDFHQQHSCNSSPVLFSVAFLFSFVCGLLLDWDPFGGNDLDETFPLFYKQVA